MQERLSDSPDDPVRQRIEENLGLIGPIAKLMYKKIKRRAPLEDLEQNGYLGLQDAAKKFDPGRNQNFKAYAALRIKGAMIDALRAFDPVARPQREKGEKMSLAEERLEAKFGRPPFPFEIAEDLTRKLDGTIPSKIPETEPFGEIETDSQASPSEENPLNIATMRDRRNYIRESIKACPTLTENEKALLVSEFIDGEPNTDFAKKISLSDSRISQIRKSAMSKLKAWLSLEKSELL